MTLRRPERVSGDQDEDVSDLSDDVFVADLNRHRRRSGTCIAARPSAEDHFPDHPAVTDFGPDTLTRYLRSEIAKAKAHNTLIKGGDKAAGHVPEQVRLAQRGAGIPVNRPNDRIQRRAGQSRPKAHNIQNDNGLDIVTEEDLSTRPPRLRLAALALQHLRGKAATDVDVDRSTRPLSENSTLDVDRRHRSRLSAKDQLRSPNETQEDGQHISRATNVQTPSGHSCPRTRQSSGVAGQQMSSSTSDSNDNTPRRKPGSTQKHGEGPFLAFGHRDPDTRDGRTVLEPVGPLPASLPAREHEPLPSLLPADSQGHIGGGSGKLPTLPPRSRTSDFEAHAKDKRRSRRLKMKGPSYEQERRDGGSWAVEDESRRPRKTAGRCIGAQSARSLEAAECGDTKTLLNSPGVSAGIHHNDGCSSAAETSSGATMPSPSKGNSCQIALRVSGVNSQTQRSKPTKPEYGNLALRGSENTLSDESHLEEQTRNTPFPQVFSYSQAVPEVLPMDPLRDLPTTYGISAPTQAKSRARGQDRGMTSNASTAATITATNRRRGRSSDEESSDEDTAGSARRASVGPFCRRWDVSEPARSPHAPPSCPAASATPARNSAAFPQPMDTDSSCLKGFNAVIWFNVVRYVSAQDVCNLRLVSKGFAEALAPVLFRNVVTKFGRNFFDINNGAWDSRTGTPPRGSMLETYGKEINKFGISFEYDLLGLAYAKPKVIQKERDAWYGKYTWPTEQYPRFAALQEIEDLVDHNRPLLRRAFANLTRASELALCVDSGHGWLEGPDMSDLAIYELGQNKGTKVFGKAFDVEDVWYAFGRNEYFKWAQHNSINEAIKGLATQRSSRPSTTREIDFLKNIEIRDYESFREESRQFDFDSNSHVGGQAITHANGGLPVPPGQNHPAALAGLAGQIHLDPQLFGPAHHRRQRRRRSTLTHEPGHTPRRTPPSKTQPQWPLIFNCHNLAAEVGGHCRSIHDKTAPPAHFPLLPGDLTESQAQWLMETVWAQRAFLSAYTTAVIMNKANLRNIHSLHIATLSSGLLPSLAQQEFWTSLPGLKTLKILIKPDWRQEHIAGDKSYATTMLIPPISAAKKFSEFLLTYISRIEHLSALTIGYVGGGEHAIGMFARNQHVLPAPITHIPRSWSSDHSSPPDPETMIKFDHIRDLRFENCWFSPCMLEAFMERSRDTSLHTLTLESVSLLSKHDSGIDGPLSTMTHNLCCAFVREEWLRETLPSSACWADVLDNITPGVTFMERKYAAGYMDKDLYPMPEKGFRGNIEKIVLKSCGYAKIGGIKGDEFNQNALVVQLHSPTDKGLRARKESFERGASVVMPHGAALPGNPGAPAHVLPVVADDDSRSSDSEASSRRIMMSTTDPGTGSEWFGLGKLTQCVHPIEKRVLEEAWGMKFGWGESMKRWAAVEDGFFEGGTGRFSGVITKDTGREGCCCTVG